MNWQPHYPQHPQYPQRPPPRRGLSGGHVAAIIGGLFLATFVVLVVVAKIRGPQSKAPKEEPRKSASEISREERAEELRDALLGKLPVKRTDPTCQRFACTTMTGDEYGDIQRAESKEGPERVKIVVRKKLKPSDVARSSEYLSLECKTGFVFTDGPLKNYAMFHMNDETHLMSANYMLPSTGHGYSPELVECVVAPFR